MKDTGHFVELRDLMLHPRGFIWSDCIFEPFFSTKL